METLPEVEQAKKLMSEAKEWSIWRWLSEKSRVREMADKGTAAQDRKEKEVKARWSEELKNAYAELTVAPGDDDDPFAAAEHEFLKQGAQALPEHIRAAAQRVKEADDAAQRARITAEETFDRAERRLSAGIARQGAEEAIAAYDLRYAAIREAEAAQSAGASRA
jgi:hypothetical protein